MPLPMGTHGFHDSPPRLQWREQHADLVTFLAAYTGGNNFLRDMQDNIRYYGWLTPAQLATTERLVAQEQGNPTPTVATMATEALTDDLPSIFNGDYTINDGVEHLTYKIHTVQNGPLTGKRIIKIQQQAGVFKGFAFLTLTGHVKVWRRFADDENRNERYIVWSRILVDYLRETAESGDGTATVLRAEGTFEIQRSLRCRRCNRPLTNPSSIDSGIGPDCAGRDENRTVAARQHETVTEVPAGPGLTVRTDTPASTRSLLSDEMPTVAETLHVVQAEDGGHYVSATPGPTETPETPEEREQRLLAEYRTTVQEFDEERLLREVRRWGSYSRGINRERFRIAYSRLPWYRQRRVCCYCGRSDFQTERGCNNHQNNYCPTLRIINGEDAARRATRLREQQEARRAAAAARGPNRSALGTVIGGEVWVQ